MRRLCFSFWFLAGALCAEPLALYLSWYGDPTKTMTIQWHTLISDEDSFLSLFISNGWSKVESDSIELGERKIYRANLDALSPDTEYSFRIGNDPTLYKFKTAPTTLDRPLKFCTGGDLYQAKHLFRQMCRTVKNHNPLFIVLGGDIAYAINGNPFRLRSSAMNQWFSFLKEWSELMMGQDGRIIPFLIVAGNHDLAPEESDLFFDLFAFPERKLYRTIDFGDYLSLFLLDSAIFDPIEGEQTDWLDQALAARTQVLGRFAIYHKSAYPCVYPYDGAIPQKIRAHWCPLFDKYELPIAFENHNHAFKRTFPIRDNRVDPSGVVYLGDGCWGAMPRKPRKDWYSAKAENKNHVYLIELEKESAKIQAVGLQGEQIDSLNLNFTKKTRS